MLRADRLALAKGLLAALIRRAAEQRERIALVCFGGSKVIEQIAPTRAGAWRSDWVKPIGGGGGTTLAPALARAQRLLSRHRYRHPGECRLLWLLTDGRTNESPSRPAPADAIRVIDFDGGRQARHRAAHWVRQWQAGPPGPDIVHVLASDLIDTAT